MLYFYLFFFFFSLEQHRLKEIPLEVFALRNLRTLNLSNNAIKELSPNSLLKNLANLKVLKCDNNKLESLPPVIGDMQKMTVLSAAGNSLNTSSLVLPTSLKELNLKSTILGSIPSIISALSNLQVLNLSDNDLVCVPGKIYSNLINLVELILDDNKIISLPSEIGNMKKLKVISLKRNLISGMVSPQAIPASLFEDTAVIDINLQSNHQITSTQLNGFDGFDRFLERRKKVKNKDLSGF